ncbi:hypothetical protein [Bradyrhizobium sp. CIR3A]|uniref:hypothetical protein n=1 Tax=Bradyrhizobium sp. CIR3A TaxID=2663838 RepID=UPI0016069F73|nr:hypothetical protein [Bradyrhizobium sp. CIR3A]MBB4262662.1 hypothetical protein [Bradyrhizobium sp. CIR3A]
MSKLNHLILEAATTDPLALVRKGRHLIAALMDELLRETETAPDLLDIASASDATKAKALERAISLSTRAQAAKNLATALTALTVQAGGKKKEAELAAERAGEDSEWGTDLLPYERSQAKN